MEISRTKPNKKSCFNAAIGLLSYRSLSEKELTDKLKRKGYDSGEIEEAVAKVKDYGYINDETLADEVFDHYRLCHIYGDRYIHQKLEKRGLATDRHLSRDEELQNAENLIASKERVMPGVAGNKRKVAGYLSRRGFSFTTISIMLDSIGAREEFME